MYKVLIVDDEVIIRNGLYNMIPWKTLEIGEVRTASCAQEALELARETKPDIVLTDICMPEMDGLEMTRLMLEFLPKLKVLVLTGYDDFKYAQKSCSLGVKEFILKPVDEVSLINSVKLQVENIKSELQSSLKCNILNRKRVLENQRAFEKSLMQLTEKMSDSDDMEIEELNLEENCQYQVCQISPVLSGDSVWLQHKNLLLISIKTILINMIDSNNSGWTFQNREGNIVVIFYIKNNGESAEEQIAKLQEIVNVEYDVDLDIGIGPVVSNISKIKSSYSKAGEGSSQNKPVLPNAADDGANPEILRQKDKLPYYKDKILESFPDTETVKMYLKLYIDEVKNSGSKKVDAEQKFYELASAFYWQYLKTTGYPADGRLETLITTLQSNDLENCCVFTEMFIAKLMYTNKKQMHEIVEAATKYINERLTEDLTVFTLAEQFHVARNYFSRLFKKEMGEGCNEYITRLRIEKAKQLLGASRLKTYEIAEKIGYHDTNYFSLAFKKNTGLSPKEFREKLNNPE
ncbi:putative response regulatory protein [Ruminiclostridium hungatei]|uniref:Stage 0 sporulation protein A homolog n=1 Tax=Ruminiclostridium hungatei TaxID=48256 RepID=A0A1V4SKQ0_RUMHU|nr:response regulator [Ruminiclostridium hungatei]OPX44394.1 putative response regulatory protein [Ruminiclostridium hungatei]